MTKQNQRNIKDDRRKEDRKEGRKRLEPFFLTLWRWGTVWRGCCVRSLSLREALWRRGRVCPVVWLLWGECWGRRWGGIRSTTITTIATSTSATAVTVFWKYIVLSKPDAIWSRVLPYSMGHHCNHFKSLLQSIPGF